jgi:hypothetical protein
MWVTLGLLAGVGIGGASKTQTVTETETTTEAQAQTEAATRAAPAPAPAPMKWRNLVSLAGQGQKRTNEFEIPSDAKIRLVYSFSGTSNDTIQLVQPGSGDSFGDLLFNEVGAKSGSTRLYNEPGEYYLDISGDSWTVKVQALK